MSDEEGGKSPADEQLEQLVVQAPTSHLVQRTEGLIEQKEVGFEYE